MSIKRNGLLIVTVAALIVLVIYFVINHYRIPAAFYEESEVLAELEQAISDEKLSHIEEILFISEKSRLIPFVTVSERFGYGVWEWTKGNWELVYVTSPGRPMLYSPGNDKQSYIIWHMKNSEQHTLSFYLLNKRGYRVSYDKEYYYPGVQMEFETESDRKAYGVLPITAEKLEVLTRMNGSNKPNHSVFSNMFPSNEARFGYRWYDPSGGDLLAEDTHSFSYSRSTKSTFNYIPWLNESEIE